MIKSSALSWVMGVDATAGGFLARISLLAGCCLRGGHRLGSSLSSPWLDPSLSPALVLQVRYKEEFEKNKGKGFSVVADTPELQRIKKTQDQISNVSVPAPVVLTPTRCPSSHPLPTTPTDVHEAPGPG